MQAVDDLDILVVTLDSHLGPNDFDQVEEAGREYRLDLSDLDKDGLHCARLCGQFPFRHTVFLQQVLSFVYDLCCDCPCRQ